MRHFMLHAGARARGTIPMNKLTPRERAELLKRVKQLNAQIQNPRLSIERVDDLHKQRAQLHARLLDDRIAR
jgi:hypothetical protein